MGSHTNVNIDSRFDYRQQLDEKISLLEFKLAYAEKRIDQLEKELINIPRAVEEWGYVDICYDNKAITLIKKPPEKGGE